MKRLLLLGIALLFLMPLQGCYVGLEPGSDGYYNGYGDGEPPPLRFEAPPDVVVMPNTSDVYVVPDINVDLFFWDGWWWRFWDGRWYRSQNYNQGWGYYNHVPSFYGDVDKRWRDYYRERNWRGQRWNYERIPQQRLQQNWKSWHHDRHWEKEKNWGVERYQPKPQPQGNVRPPQRQDQYNQQRVNPVKPQPTGNVKPPQRQDQYNQQRIDLAKPQPQGNVKPPQRQDQYNPQRIEPVKPQPTGNVKQAQKQEQFKQPKIESVKPQSQGNVQQPKSQKVKPQVQETVKPQQPRPKSREVLKQQPQSKQSEAPQQVEPRHEKPLRGGDATPDKI